jgi:hypothetical protein
MSMQPDFGKGKAQELPASAPAVGVEMVMDEVLQHDILSQFDARDRSHGERKRERARMKT